MEQTIIKQLFSINYALFYYLCTISKNNNNLTSQNMPALGREREITEREKAIITAAIFNKKDQTQEDWDKIFLLSRNGATKIQVKSRGSSQSVSWKSRSAVKKFHQQESERVDKIFRDRENKAITDFLRNKSKDEICSLWERLNENKSTSSALRFGALDATGESDNGKAENIDILQPLEVDFRDREQFLNFLNAEANRIKDGKTRLDVLKMLSDLQRMKEAENGKNGEIQRFYTPLQCSECVLYRKEKAEIESD